MSETAGIPPEELLGTASKKTSGAPEQSTPASAERVAATAPVAPATDAKDHVTYHPTVATSAEVAPVSNFAPAPAEAVADESGQEGGDPTLPQEPKEVIEKLKSDERFSKLGNFAESMVEAFNANDHTAAFLYAGFAISIIGTLRTADVVPGYESDESSSSLADLETYARDIAERTFAKQTVLLSGSLRDEGLDALATALTALTTNSSVEAVQEVSRQINQIIDRSLYGSVQQLLITLGLVMDIGATTSDAERLTKEAERISGQGEALTEAREEEMNRIANALTATYDKDFVKAGLLDTEETKAIAEIVKNAGIKNPQLTHGDLRVEALKALRAVVNARSNKGDQMTSWNAKRYTDFTNLETQALNAVFGAKTHDARLGIVYRDGNVVKPDGNYYDWEKEVKNLQKIDDPSVKFDQSAELAPVARASASEIAVDKELRGAMDGAKVMSLMSEEQWGMARKLFKNEAPKAMSVLAKVVSEKGLPKSEQESLALRVDFVNAISGFNNENDHIIMDVHEVMNPLLSPETPERYVEIVPITHEQVILTQWLDSIFGSTDSLLFWDNSSRKLVAKDAFSAGQENEGVQRRLRLLRGMRQTMLGFGSRPGTLVVFFDSVMAKANSLPSTWRPGQPQPFEVIRDVAPEQAATMISS